MIGTEATSVPASDDGTAASPTVISSAGAARSSSASHVTWRTRPRRSRIPAAAQHEWDQYACPQDRPREDHERGRDLADGEFDQHVGDTPEHGGERKEGSERTPARMAAGVRWTPVSQAWSLSPPPIAQLTTGVSGSG
jgi:hypothetical protein